MQDVPARSLPAGLGEQPAHVFRSQALRPVNIPPCPLCESRNVELLESIDVRVLAGLYRRIFKVDTSGEFQGVRTLALLSCRDCELAFFDPPIAGTERFYEALQRFDWYYMEEKHEFEYAKRYVRASDSVLEVGCGRGAFGTRLRAKEYVGLEFNERAIRTATQAGLRVIKESVEEHRKNNSGKYDVVCAFQVLEHVPKVRSFIDACIACVRPGGLLIFAVPSASSFARYISNSILDMPPHHVTRWSDGALRNCEKLFPLECVTLWHEPLHSVHYESYGATIFMNALRRLLGWQFESVDTSLSTRALWLASRLAGRLFAYGLEHSDLLPRGMSVTAVYQKGSVTHDEANG